MNTTLTLAAAAALVGTLLMTEPQAAGPVANESDKALAGVFEAREKDGVFSIAGIPNPAKVRADLFNNLNNPGKVSANLLTDADVQELAVQGQTMLLVRIPQATRKQRPVFLNGQPLGHTYKRLNDGDRLCDEETVKRMLASAWMMITDSLPALAALCKALDSSLTPRPAPACRLTV